MKWKMTFSTVWLRRENKRDRKQGGKFSLQAHLFLSSQFWRKMGRKKCSTMHFTQIPSIYSSHLPLTLFISPLTQEEIDICGHIFHLLKKSIEKQSSRTIMLFPSLIMGLIAKTRLKLLSGLTVVQRDYPIGAHTVTRSTAHIKGSKTGVHTIP